MIKSLSKIEEGTRKDSQHGNKQSLGNLDLLNLRLNFDPEDGKHYRTKESLFNTPRNRKSFKGSGDSYCSPRQHHHPLERAETKLVPNLSKVPKGYGNYHPKPPSIPSENLILLYSKERHPERVFTEPITRKDFLFPSKKKTKTQIIDVVSEDRMSKYNSRVTKVESGRFPFKLTKSGNLKVETSQVVFSSNKLSVLVADPKNTKVNIHQEVNCGRMAHETDFSKTSAMDTIMSQAGFSSLGTILGNTPVRSGNKEASEYESKQTSEILDPELNLGRLGYSGTDEISWQKVALPEKKNLYLELYSRITNYTNADCKVYIDNEEFNCHLIVLQCYSELFDAYIAVKKVELPSDKCSASAFAFIYEWMITGEPSYRELNRDNVLDIFNSAKYLKIKDLVEQCWAFIDHADVFTEDTAFLLYMDAKDKNLPEVRELMLPRVQGFFLMLVSSQNWLELELADVKSLLRSNYICVNCEMEIFMSAVRWLKHDWSTRDKYKYEILDCVRFGNIAPWQLVDIKRNPENPDFMELAKDARICKMIDDGLAYVIIKYWYGQENDDFQHWNAVLGLQEPPPRNWSGSDKTYFTYREFLIYLDQYRRNQLIEKNKPRITNEPKPEQKERFRNTAAPVENNTPRVPTMEEFLSKKKVEDTQVYYSVNTNNDWANCQDFQTNRRRQAKRGLSRTRAAIIIQRAFRRHRARKRRNVTKKETAKPHHRAVTKHMKPDKVLEMFTPSQNQLARNDMNKLSTSALSPVRKVYLTESSLFEKNRETVLVFGGVDPYGDYGVGRNTGKDIFRYRPDENTWEFVGKLPEPRHHHCAQFFKGRIYVVGGADPREDELTREPFIVTTVWSFDPVSRGWYSEPHLLEARKNFGLVACNHSLYAFGGQGNDYQALKTLEVYNVDSRKWEQRSPMIQPRIGMGYAKYRNCIWVAGGLAGSYDKRFLLDSVESYNLASNQWTKVNYPLRFPRCFSCMFVMSDNLYIIGGAGKASDMDKSAMSIAALDLWDRNLMQWKNVNELNIPRHGHSLTCFGTQILIAGGVTTIYRRALSNTECFCSKRGAWVRGLACLPIALSGHTLITLPPISLISY